MAVILRVACASTSFASQNSAVKTKLTAGSLPPVEKTLQMSFSDIGVVDDVVQYLKWTFPLSLFTDYYDSAMFLPGGASQDLSKLRHNSGMIGQNTRLIGR
jgi:hypothetical protein